MTELHSAARPAGDRADIREQRGQPGAGDDLPGERGHRRHHQAQGGGRETDHRHAVQGHHLQVGTTGSPSEFFGENFESKRILEAKTSPNSLNNLISEQMLNYFENIYSFKGLFLPRHK